MFSFNSTEVSRPNVYRSQKDASSAEGFAVSMPCRLRFEATVSTDAAGSSRARSERGAVYGEMLTPDEELTVEAGEEEGLAGRVRLPGIASLGQNTAEVGLFSVEQQYT